MPSKAPIIVPVIIPIKKFPFTLRKKRGSVMSKVRRVVKAVGSLNFANATNVLSLPTMSPPFFNPRKAIKSPIPAVIALIMDFGMERDRKSAHLLIEVKVNTIPAIKTAASACCHVSPIENTSVKTKNDVSPKPGMRINGDLAHKAMNKQPIIEVIAVAIVAAS